jgi:hypothetical protein
MMNRVKDFILREYGDQGADTFEKQWAQIEYTAYWCIHLIMPNSGILSITPEGVDDLNLERADCRELYQVKCRDDTQRPWTTAEVLPILCQQYHRRLAFPEPCQFHFVSDYVADTTTQFKPGVSYGALSRLKQLLDIQHTEQPFMPQEETEFSELEDAIISRIIVLLKENHEEVANETTAKELLHSTWIDTNSNFIRRRPVYDELAEAMVQAFPGQPVLTLFQVREVFERILMLIVKKIIMSQTLEERKIIRDEVLSCRSIALTLEHGLPNLDLIAGSTRAEKKARYGGFDVSELPVFENQRIRAGEKQRKLVTLGLGDQVTDLSLSLITWQQHFRRAISNETTHRTIGPDILERMRNKISECVKEYFPNHEVDDVFGHGLIWQETNQCNSWWHRIENCEKNDGLSTR